MKSCDLVEYRMYAIVNDVGNIIYGCYKGIRVAKTSEYDIMRPYYFFFINEHENLYLSKEGLTSVFEHNDHYNIHEFVNNFKKCEVSKMKSEDLKVNSCYALVDFEGGVTFGYYVGVNEENLFHKLHKFKLDRLRTICVYEDQLDMVFRYDDKENIEKCSEKFKVECAKKDEDPEMKRTGYLEGTEGKDVVYDSNIYQFNSMKFDNLESQDCIYKLMDNSRLLNAMMGLSGEVGEAVDIVKKHIWQGHTLDKEHLKRELGDVAWYLAKAADALGIGLSDIFEANYDKLSKRYGDKFDSDKSINRDPNDI